MQLLKIVQVLKTKYPHKKFTLDGRLVGDLGEILVEQSYKIKLYEKLAPHYDGETPDGKKVQIKATMKNALGFPADYTPQHYLGIKISETGEFEEIYNGPGKYIASAIKNRQRPSNGLHSISINKLKKLNEKVKKDQRIKTR